MGHPNSIFAGEKSRLDGRSLCGVKDSSGEPIDGLGIGDAFEPVIDHPHWQAVGFVPPISFRRIHVAEIGAIRKTLLASHAHILFHPPQ